MSTVAPTQSTLPTPPAGAPAPSWGLSDLYRFTVEQYERMGEAGILAPDDRVELISGYLVTKMPKGPEHVWVIKRGGNRLESLLGDALTLRREAPVRIPDLNEPEPDLAVARGDDTLYLQRHPGPSEIPLLIEVSDTTYHRDRYEKYPVFAKANIPAYWIINLPKRQIEVYTDPCPEGYRSRRDYRAGESIPIVIDGRALGEVAVEAILPPPTVPNPEGNGGA